MHVTWRFRFCRRCDGRQLLALGAGGEDSLGSCHEWVEGLTSKADCAARNSPRHAMQMHRAVTQNRPHCSVILSVMIYMMIQVILRSQKVD
jgi:hypothetical protein